MHQELTDSLRAKVLHVRKLTYLKDTLKIFQDVMRNLLRKPLRTLKSMQVI